MTTARVAAIWACAPAPRISERLNSPTSDPPHFCPPLRRYACYYVTRNSLTYTAPTMLNDAALGLTMTQIGGLTSILPIAYGAALTCLPPTSHPTLHAEACRVTTVWRWLAPGVCRYS